MSTFWDRIQQNGSKSCAGLLVLTLGLLSSFQAIAELDNSRQAEQATAPSKTDSAETDSPGKWYFGIGNSNNHPGLKDAEKKIDREINKTFRLLAPGFDDIKTFSDQRDDLMIWTPFVLLGRTLSDNWNVFAQMGYTQGYVRTKSDNLSLILLPLHTDVRLDRSTFYAGLGAEYFPWGMPESRKYHGLCDRLKNTKPFVGGKFDWNYLTADCDVKAGFKPFGNIIHIEQHEVWRTCAVGAFAGVSIPVNEDTNLVFNATYNHFLRYGDDFSGPSFVSFWQFKF